MKIMFNKNYAQRRCYSIWLVDDSKAMGDAALIFAGIVFWLVCFQKTMFGVVSIAFSFILYEKLWKLNCSRLAA